MFYKCWTKSVNFFEVGQWTGLANSLLGLSLERSELTRVYSCQCRDLVDMIWQEYQQRYMPDSYAYCTVGVPKDEDLKTAHKNVMFSSISLTWASYVRLKWPRVSCSSRRSKCFVSPLLPVAVSLLTDIVLARAGAVIANCKLHWERQDQLSVCSSM